jgi:exodeoxyribonuclease-3
VGLHVRKGALPHPPVFAHPTFNFENRIVTAEFGRLVVASIYVPNGGKDFPAKIRFLEQLEAYVVENLAAGKDLVLCGDINIARSERDVHPKERNPCVIGQTPDERALLERILGRGLVDLGRSLDPANDQLFTWWPPWRNMRQRNIGWRLDYLFASAGIAHRVSECKVLAEVGTSDHAPVIATIDPAPGV